MKWIAVKGKKLVRELLRGWQALYARPKSTHIAVQRTVPLGQKAVATMLKVNGELLLLGVTSASVTLIERWPLVQTSLEMRGTVQ
jgi:flagellar biogenesis protein FliO